MIILKPNQLSQSVRFVARPRSLGISTKAKIILTKEGTGESAVGGEDSQIITSGDRTVCVSSFPPEFMVEGQRYTISIVCADGPTAGELAWKGIGICTDQVDRYGHTKNYNTHTVDTRDDDNEYIILD